MHGVARHLLQVAGRHPAGDGCRRMRQWQLRCARRVSGPTTCWRLGREATAFEQAPQMRRCTDSKKQLHKNTAEYTELYEYIMEYIQDT